MPGPAGVERLVLFGRALAASAAHFSPKKLSGTPAGLGIYECSASHLEYSSVKYLSRIFLYSVEE
jgi:hypothetical protein